MNFGGTDLATEFDAATQIKGLMPAARLALRSPGQGPVCVTNQLNQPSNTITFMIS
jgi:hypothetical protein